MNTGKESKTMGTAKPESPPEKQSITTLYTPEQRGQLALSSELQAAAVMQGFQKNVMGGDVDLEALVHGIIETTKQVKDDDLHRLESMLVSQATSLQSIFTDLARKAQAQTYLKHFETYLGLALKAQAQSRATITALGELKNPRHATFVKQANIAHGPQQVNNGVMPTEVSCSREKKQKTEQNKLLEAGDGKFSIGVVPGKTATPKPSHKGMEALEPVHRAKKCGR
jgi:uncharacterized protein YyaL (SSP411 family)